jgi:hypothetical protein
VIDNVVWTDYWLSIAGAGCGLTRVGAGEEQARKVIAGEASEAEDTRQDRKAFVEAKQVAVVGHPSNEENPKISKFILEGLVSLVIK